MSIGYTNKVVLRNINFEINQGEYVFILGDNGVGKTTLLKTLLGLIPPLKGEIIYDSSIKKTSIGYIPQKSKIQQEFPASVYEIVLSGCVNTLKWKPFYTKKEKEKVADAMKLLNISHLAKRPYRELSGGQQQRVLLARALCAAKQLLLLDEPVTGLDPKATNEMYELIADLNKNDDITIIMVSHDINAAVRYASHILHIGSTQLFFGKKKDYIKSTVGKSFIEIIENE
jgi:zinc transport system ATP-binding protein